MELMQPVSRVEPAVSFLIRIRSFVLARGDLASVASPRCRNWVTTIPMISRWSFESDTMRKPGREKRVIYSSPMKGAHCLKAHWGKGSAEPHVGESL